MTDLSEIRGLYIAQLDEEERDIFSHACEKQEAYFDYSGPAGIFGIAKVGVVKNDQA